MSDTASNTSALSVGTMTSMPSLFTETNDRRKLKLIEKYSSGRILEFNKSSLQSINRAVRKVLVPRMKFLSTSKSFGSFEQPDFTDPNCWIHRVFNQLGAYKDLSDTKKAELWMTYRSKVKEQFSLHRSTVTLALKNIFIKGKFSELNALQTYDISARLSDYLYFSSNVHLNNQD